MRLKVMIVDDEITIRKGICAKVNWQELGLHLQAEAGDGAEALEYTALHEIDIMITDINMPEIDGLRLIKKVSESHKNMKFIVISGYSEFEYARTAMQYGVSEYLLKPVVEKELQSSLIKLREELLRPESVLIQEHMVKEKLMKRDEALYRLIANSNDKEAAHSLLKKSDIHFMYPYFSAGIIKLELEEDVPYSKLASLFEEIVESEGISYLCKGKATDEFIFLLNIEQLHQAENLKLILKRWMNEIKHSLGADATIGQGSWVEGIHLVNQSFNEAQTAIKERILKGNGYLYNFSEISMKPVYLNLESESTILIQLIKDKKKKELNEYIHHLFHNYTQTRKITNYSQVIELFLEIYFIVKNAAQEKKGEAFVAAQDGDITDIISRFESLEQMIFCLYEYAETVMDQLSEGHDTSGREIVDSVRKYIQDFYGSDITLNKISKKNHINPIYFSRIFKSYVGENFNNYLTRIRMEEAMKLMNSSSLKIHEISGIIGYEDPKYFSKVFKKHFGKSPSLYSAKP